LGWVGAKVRTAEVRKIKKKVLRILEAINMNIIKPPVILGGGGKGRRMN
jgi:hypothetical protein